MSTIGSPTSKYAHRLRVWTDLRRLNAALPDSRFGFDFSAFIPDFRGSSSAIEHLVDLPCYKSSRTIFIAPDNSLQGLRFRALKDGKRVLTTTYAIRRGFILLDPGRIEQDSLQLASLLDGMERPSIGTSVSISQMHEQIGRIGLCVTGAGAIGSNGIRIGKDHGFFDLAWGMLFDRELVNTETPVAAIVHQCQVVQVEQHDAEQFVAAPWDVPCNLIIIPDKVYRVAGLPKPQSGILWNKLEPKQLESILVLQELKGIQMMEKIMKAGTGNPEPAKPKETEPSADELLGIQMMERIMKGLKP
ncbi:nagb/rpia/CoA transferase-like protein [Polyplosphaeria fusca]|uniref:Nagb/rpia/CoA transferase-like protein n=1 Tax=Polyplosphaeria fusca TaxID=682080 RepID=A0A9P4QX53_9PLEO|nr:nagb/rpia/CoA transferase-like protein [Polyplosphaeria fusca]